MTERAFHFVQRENQARQQDGPLHFGKREHFNLFADCIQSSGVVFLPRLLEAIVAHGAAAVWFAAVVLSEPSVSSGQSVELVDQGLVVFWRMRIEQIAFPENF